MAILFTTKEILENRKVFFSLNIRNHFQSGKLPFQTKYFYRLNDGFYIETNGRKIQLHTTGKRRQAITPTAAADGFFHDL